jgi:hypothetical protein
MINLMQPKTTDGLICDKRGMTLSMTLKLEK